MIHSDLDRATSAWRFVSYICFLQKALKPLSFFQNQFVLLASCFSFCQCCLQFEFLCKVAYNFYFFLWVSGTSLSAIFILRFRICFEQNDDKVDGRASSVSFWFSKANCSANFFFNRYSFIRATSFSSYFFGSKYFLFSRSDLFLAAS